MQGHTEYIATGDNVLADMLSRLPDKSLTPSSYASFLDQAWAYSPPLRTYRFFQPSPEFLSRLRSVLLQNECLPLKCLPSELGQFVPTAPATYNGALL